MTTENETNVNPETQDEGVLSQSEVDALKPEDIAVLPPETLEKIENAETPEEVDEHIREALANQDLEANAALLAEAQTPAGKSSISDAGDAAESTPLEDSALAEGESDTAESTAENIPVI